MVPVGGAGSVGRSVRSVTDYLPTYLLLCIFFVRPEELGRRLRVVFFFGNPLVSNSCNVEGMMMLMMMMLKAGRLGRFISSGCCGCSA